jgi:hypothetical protein
LAERGGVSFRTIVGGGEELAGTREIGEEAERVPVFGEV